MIRPEIPGDKVHGDIEQDLQGGGSQNMPIDEVDCIDNDIDRGKEEIANIGLGRKKDADNSADSSDELITVS